MRRKSIERKGGEEKERREVRGGKRAWGEEKEGCREREKWKGGRGGRGRGEGKAFRRKGVEGQEG